MSTFSEVRELPSTMAIMVVDSKGFSRYKDTQQSILASAIPDVLERAGERCGVPQLWGERRFPDSTGDGYIVGFDQRYLPYVVHGYLDALQAELHELNHHKLIGNGMSLRLRLSLNLGPVEQLQDVRLDSPVGTTMIDTHRLVDCDPLRGLLTRSDEKVTMLAAALSEQVMETVVRGGYSGRQESEFVPTVVTVEGKDFTGTAYLRVPAPSGDLLLSGLLETQKPEQPPGGEPSESGEVPAPQPESATTVAGTGNLVGSGDDSSQLANSGAGAVTAGGDADGNITAGRDVKQENRHEVVHGDKYHADRDVHGGRRFFTGGSQTGEKS
ncbi:MAG: hypothetical protein ACRD0P_11240 [Stackebrandtia sp.]